MTGRAANGSGGDPLLLASGIEKRFGATRALAGVDFGDDAGATILTVPAAFTVPTGRAHWHVLLRARAIEAVYLGGGTPSALSAADLSRILTTVRRRLPLAPDCEITIEGRIIHFDPEKIDACLEAGANRISIGVQSFDTTVRTRQGRRSEKEQVIRFLEDIRRRDRAALVVDLMFGLPGQTPEVWREDLRICDALGPDGVDLYGINIIPGTPLHRALEVGKFAAAPTLTDLGAMYRAGSEFLAGRGWRQISNSHWGRTARERNRYNLMIKAGTE